MNAKLWVMGGVVLGVLVSGCARKDEKVSEKMDAPSVEEQIFEATNTLSQLSASAGLQTALAESVKQVSVAASPELRQALVYWGVEQITGNGESANVEPYIMALLAVDEEFARLATRMLTPIAMQESPEVWVEFLTDTNRPVMFRSFGHNIWLEHFSASASEEDVEDVLASLQDPVFEVHRPGLYRYALSRAMEHTDTNRIWNLLAYLEEALPDDTNVSEVLLNIEGQALIRDARLQDAFVFYRDHAKEIGDVRLANVLFRLLIMASEKNDADLIASIQEWGYAATDFSSVRNRVARWDLQQLRVEEGVKTVVNGVRDVIAKDIPVQVVSSYFLSDLYYPALEKADVEGLQDLRDLLMSMNDKATDAAEHIRSSIGSALLDVYFYQEDFQAALERIRSGIPGFDEDWHTELLDKVQAHLAQQEGRLRDAIGFYQKHIERAKGWTKPFRAPENGRLVLPVEVIALNERRIGDLWKQEGEMEKAAAAYSRAVEQYQEALQEYIGAEDALSQAEIEKVLSELVLENP